MQEQIERDLKAAMLSGDKQKTEILRNLKSALQYEAVSVQSTDRVLNDQQVQKVLAKEAKKRQDAAEIYQKNNEMKRAEAELNERKIISGYLPEKMDDDQLAKVVDREIAKLESPTVKDMGQVIGSVRAVVGMQADGAVIASMVKERLASE